MSVRSIPSPLPSRIASRISCGVSSRIPDARRRRRCLAFSLYESLLVVALAGVLATLAWPTVTDVVRRCHVEWTTHALVGAIGYARAEAVRRGASTTVCRSDTRDRCSSQARECGGRVAPGHDWRCGWAVVAGHRTARTGLERAPVLRRFTAPRGVTVIGTRGMSAMTFRAPSGLAPGAAGHLEVGADVSASHRRGDVDRSRLARWNRCLLIGMTGRVRVSEGPCGREERA